MKNLSRKPVLIFSRPLAADSFDHRVIKIKGLTVKFQASVI